MDLSLGKRITKNRKRLGLTQDQLAEKLGITAQAVSKWENDLSCPDISILPKLADIFSISTDELLGRTKEWKYAVIAAQTKELGQQIASMLTEHGYAARGIFTDYDTASELANGDESIRYVIAGFHTGFYGGCESAPTLVVVAPTDSQILDSFRSVFERYLD